MTNIFSNWTTEDIVDWVCKYKSNPFLQNSYNYDTYIFAIDELKIRKLSTNDINRLSKITDRVGGLI